MNTERKTIYQLKPDIINRIKKLISAKPVRMSTLTVEALKKKIAEPEIQNNVVDTANVSIGVKNPTMTAPVAPVEATRPIETIAQTGPTLQSPVIPVGLPNGVEPLNPAMTEMPAFEPQPAAVVAPEMQTVASQPIDTVIPTIENNQPYNYQEMPSTQMNSEDNISAMDDARQILDTPKEVMETSIKNDNEEKEKLTMDELLKEMIDEAVKAAIEPLQQKIEMLEKTSSQNLDGIKRTVADAQAAIDATNRFGQAIQPDFSQAQREQNISYQRVA